MRKPLIIGEKTYKTKKEAREHYSRILNSYNFGESLNDGHYNDLVDLINHYVDYIDNEEDSDNHEENVEDLLELAEAESESTPNNNEEISVVDIRIGRFQFNTKCFEVVYSDGSTWIISYRVFINKTKMSPRSIFNKVCRHTIQQDLIFVKQNYFKEYAKNSKAPCQESREYLKYEDLVVDHRQPNTLSVIIDRFIELFDIDVVGVEYVYYPDKLTTFKDDDLSIKFRKYHKEKALLRVVNKDLNLSRSGMARLKEMKDDIKVRNYL